MTEPGSTLTPDCATCGHPEDLHDDDAVRCLGPASAGEIFCQCLEYSEPGPVPQEEMGAWLKYVAKQPRTTLTQPFSNREEIPASERSESTGTTLDLEAIKTEHYEEQWPQGHVNCRKCQRLWPCETMRVLGEVVSLRAQLADYKDGAEEEARAGDEARAQVAELRAQLADLQSRRHSEQADLEEARRQRDEEWDRNERYGNELRQELTRLGERAQAAEAERDAARGELDLRWEYAKTVPGLIEEACRPLNAVVEAAGEYAGNKHVNACRWEYRHCTCGYDDLRKALDAAEPKTT